MESFTFHVPTKFVFGRGAEGKAGEEAKALGARRALVHYGSGSCVRSGLLARVEASLRDAGIETVALGGVVPNPRLGLVKEGAALARKEELYTYGEQIEEALIHDLTEKEREMLEKLLKKLVKQV